MRIQKLTVENIKLLADQTFDFGEGPGGWTLLLGENGLCKTTILQAIAIATSGDRLARALVADAQSFVRANRTDRVARLRAEISLPDGRIGKTELQVEPGSHAFEPAGKGTFDFNPIRGKRTPGYFVVGYGVGRYLPRRGEVAVPTDPVKDRVEGIFDAHHKMLGVDFFEALKEKNLHLKYAKALREVLIAENKAGARLLPLLDNVDLRGKSGVNALEKLLESRRFTMALGAEKIKLPADQLSQGYQSMIAWIADLLGHAFLEQGETSAEKLKGLVLLDEIDLHLHPTWQRVLVPLLRQAFPLVQFIATTHSPLVLAGCDAKEILELLLGDDGVEHRHSNVEPGLRTSSELLDTFFHVPHAARPDLLESYRRMLELQALSGKTPKQAAELKKLGHELAAYRRPLEDAALLDPRSVANGRRPR